MTNLTPGLYTIADAMFYVFSNGDYVHYDTGEVITDKVNQIQAEGFEVEAIEEAPVVDERPKRLPEGEAE